jgi:TRAP-type mannitol/chloroaromatic compound transport system substrate-binding protein
MAGRQDERRVNTVNRKAVLWLVSVVAVVGLVLLGCAPEAAPPAEGEEAPAEAEEEEAAPAPAAPAAEVITWKVQDSYDAANPAHVHAELACNRITEASGGRLVWKSFTGGAIVPATKEMDAVDMGTVDATYTCTMYNLDKWVEAGLFSAHPGPMTAEAAPVWFQYYGIDLINRMAADYNVLALEGICPQPPEIFAHSLKDIKGLRMRTSGDGGEVMTKLGASVVFMPGGELYEAMQRGVIDAFEYSCASTDWQMSFQEIAQYLIFSSVRAPCDPLVWYVNKDSWNGLDASLQAVVLNVIQATMREQQMWVENNNIEAVQNFRDFGCVLTHLPFDVEQAFLAAAEEFYAEKAAEAGPLFGEILKSQNDFCSAYAYQAGLNTPLAS